VAFDSNGARFEFGGLTVFKFEMSGMGDLEKTLADAQHAIESVSGVLATLSIDQSNPQLAIAEMERLVDTKLVPYKYNAIVQQLAQTVKEQFKAQILGRVEEAKSKN
jgi:hypothetical protein